MHANDRRQREPDVNHLLRVAIRILSHSRVADPDVARRRPARLRRRPRAGHDARRHPAGCLVILAGRFGQRTAGLVAAVTNPVYAAGCDEHEQYREHVIASLEADPWARVIKASDFTDYAVGLFHTTGPSLTRLAGKYAPVPVLRELILRAGTPLDPDVKDMIARQLYNAEDRFAAIAD
jgi:hypothetical protein